MPAHPKSSDKFRDVAQRRARAMSSGTFGYMATFNDDELDGHITYLESWLDFQAEEMEAALAERERRGGARYELTPTAEAWLVANAHRLEALI